MALNNLGLGFVFTARDLASARIQSLQRRFSTLDERITGGAARMTSAFHQLGIGLAVFTAGAATLAGSFALASAAGRFEQGLAAVGAVTRATTQDLAMLREAAIEAGIRTQFSPDEAVSGLLSLATAGQTALQSTQTLLPVLDLAAGSLGQLGVAEAAEAVVGTLNAYGLAATEAVGVTDRLLRITQLTNFQTRDFEGGLAKAAAAGSVFGQSLDDVLITMGLLRNRNIDASSSGTAFREAVRRVGAESRAQQAVLGAGVDIFDQTSGRMRSIIDIINDFARATEGMTEQERNRRVVTAFGARGLLAFNAVLNASYTTTRDGTQVTLRGAEAIAAMREEMGRAEGTAARFREQLLNTFEGQKTLLRGTLQTFAVVLGEPFAQVFKPIVKAIVDTLNAVLRVFQVLPAPIKRAIAALTLVFGGLLTLAGGAITVAAVITLVSLVADTLVAALAGVVAVLAPAIAAVLVLAGVVAGFAVAFRRNVGGIADLARRAFGQVRLGFQGLVQLFQQGGFSGAVREELGRAENQGLRQFLINAFRIVHRVRQVWVGFREGFVQTIDAARPAFEELVAALRELGGELSDLVGDAAGGAAALPTERFRAFGAIIGSALATAIRWIAQLVTAYARIEAGVVGGYRAMVEYLGPALSVVRDSLVHLGSAWRELVRSLHLSTSSAGESGSVWRSLGEVLGRVVGGAIIFLVLALAGAIRVLAVLVQALSAVYDAAYLAGFWIGTTIAQVYLWFTQTLPAAIASAVASVRGFLAAIGQVLANLRLRFLVMLVSITAGVGALLQPVVEHFQQMARSIAAVLFWLRDTVLAVLRQVPAGFLPESLAQLARQPLTAELNATARPAEVQRTEVAAARAEAATSAMPAASEAQGRAGISDQLEARLAALVSGLERRGQQPLNVNVQVDGETIARATHNANQANAGRAFSPVPTF